MAIATVRRGEAIAVLASTARTADPAVDTFWVQGARGLILIIDCTAITLTPSVVFTIVGVDPVSGKTFTILASAAIVAIGTTVLRVHPDLTAVANEVASDVVPVQWSVTAVHADGDSITYSVGAQLV